jgi:hypothetical protein
MRFGLTLLTVTLACGRAGAASHQTANFVVDAPTAEVARRIGETAERCRKELARQWLEGKLADWAFPCRIDVTVTLGGIGGFTDVNFSDARVCQHSISVRGPLERIEKSALPHEITHVLFAHFFGFQPPRWADEGGAILSEDHVQSDEQRKLVQKILSEEKCVSLRRLLAIRDYGADVSFLYAQGHSLSCFLMSAGSRRQFLTFVREGVSRGWDHAVSDCYGYDNVEQLERAWRTWALPAQKAPGKDGPR